MGKLDDLSQKITYAAEEVADTINSAIEKAKTPEAKEKAHKAVTDAGEWIGHAANAVDNAVSGFIDELNKGFEKGRKQ